MQKLCRYLGRQRVANCVQALTRTPRRALVPAAPAAGLGAHSRLLETPGGGSVSAADVAADVGSLRQQHSLAISDAMILSSTGDIYDGINIDAEQLPAEPAEFADSLQQSLQEWQQTARKGIWLKVPISHAQLVPVATQQGFYFHHAEPDYVMLARWLPDSENKLPGNASHQVGVGAFVFDRQGGRVLMVQERNGPLKGKGVWKMPTGLAMAREDIADAAEREVLEETGVRAKSVGVIAIRQAHTALFGKSDLFAVVALEPEDSSQDGISVQEDELVAAEWQSLEQFEANPFPNTIPLLNQIVERCLAYARGEYAGLKLHKFPVPSRGREDILLYGTNNGTNSSGPASGL